MGKLLVIPLVFLLVVSGWLGLAWTGTKAELGGTLRALADNGVQLTRMQAQQAESEAQLRQTQTQLSKSEAQFTQTQAQLSEAEARLAQTEGQVLQMEENLTLATEQLSEIQLKYDALLEGQNHYALRDPTYRELQHFLDRDKTDEKKYVKDGYVCVDFAAAVNNNAEAKGIRSAYVSLVYPDSGHAIVAFQTIDRGLVYIEPQLDREVKLKVGFSYSRVNDFELRNGTDDTIVRALIVW